MAAISYLDFDLLIERSPTGYRARVLSSPAGQAAADFKLPFSELEIENFLLRIGRTQRGMRRLESPEMETARTFGGRLFEAVFDHEVRGCLRSSLDEADRQGAGLRIRLRLTDVPELADLPWEYLHNPSLNRFLVLSAETPLVRYLDLPEPIRPLAVKPPMRVLVMIASPNDYPPLDVEREWAKLNEALGDLEQRGLLALERLKPATLAALQRHLRQGEYHIFHFVGHGAFDERSQDGVLLLEDDEGRGRAISGQYLGTLMHDERTLRLAILNACEGARTSRSDPFAGAAQSLVQQGVPAVIAMQFEITDEAAIVLAHEFYAALADGYPVDAALAEARKAIFAQGNNVEWGKPVLYLRAPDGRIFDVERVSEQERAQAQVAALYQQARTALVRQEWAAAVEKLQAVLALDPNHAGAAADLSQARQQQELADVYTRGRQHYAAGRWREARDAFRQVQARAGDYKDVLTLIAGVEQAITREEAPPAPRPTPPPSRNWLWIGISAVVALLLMCGGGMYALFKVLNPAIIVQPTPIVIGSAPPPMRLATATPSPAPRATPTPAPVRPTSRPTFTPTPVQPVMPEIAHVVLFLGGDPFEDPRVLEAIGLGVPWAQVSEDFFPGQEVLITVQTRGQEFALATDVGYDPELAKMLMAEAGYPEALPVRLVYTVGDEPIQYLAEAITATLGNTGFQVVELMGMPEVEANEIVAAAVDTGETVMWLHRP
jgi:CHAT domain-containing protein